VASLVLAMVILVPGVDTTALREAGAAMVAAPGWVVLALAAFGAAFGVRALLWHRVLPDLPVPQALAGIHLALGANHVLPLRLGEPLRVVSVVRRTDTSFEAATASTVTLRAADILAIAGLGVAAGPALFSRLLGVWGWALLAVVAAVGVAGLVWLHRVAGRRDRVRLPGPVVALGSMLAWALEAVLVWCSARFVGIELTGQEAVLVTTVAVGAQTVAIAPSGLGTYEAASAAAYAALGHDAGVGFAAALTAHALKTAYSLVAGGVAVFVPAPGLLGRVRLPRTTPDEPLGRADRPTRRDAEAPVVLFLPAHDEEATVADVVRRAPATVAGHPVHVLVVDDGSTDATAARARAAGAEVLSLPENRGLGAAVREGLRAAVDRDAVAVAFCDADGEYAPEELDVLVAPLLAGEADYVVGSRFGGTITSMRPHRRVGNVALTRLLSFVARRPLSDGQSGYRALSGAAAADAEVIHDFNYAQVLTLDLLAKGWRYAEVPITYGFRTQGRSFVRPGAYLRAVTPAVWREVQSSTT
jgi:uncharacterized membrane protein YbhN (UPF0104 family)